MYIYIYIFVFKFVQYFLRKIPFYINCFDRNSELSSLIKSEKRFFNFTCQQNYIFIFILFCSIFLSFFSFLMQHILLFPYMIYFYFRLQGYQNKKHLKEYLSIFLYVLSNLLKTYTVFFFTIKSTINGFK